MGDDNRVKDLNLPEKSVNNYDVVKERFHSFFVAKKNIHNI